MVLDVGDQVIKGMVASMLLSFRLLVLGGSQLPCREDVESCGEAHIARKWRLPASRHLGSESSSPRRAFR